MAPATKKRRVNGNAVVANDASPDQTSDLKPPLSPATSEEKREWQGFCEIDSEPAYFNVMLREWGVKGVKVQEVYGLEDAMLAFLPQPVYGLIFLFKYRPDPINKQEMSCPEDVWFANQTHDHACATVSLLNIVLNIPDADLGENLTRFKDFTRTLTPALRGDQIGNFEFVKQIHNSFTRKIDMLNIDLGLQNAYDDRSKSRAKPKPKPKPKPKSKPTNTKKTLKTKQSPPSTSSEAEEPDNPPFPSEEDEDDNSAFHFIAYVPIKNSIYKLDGLDRQPQKLATYDPASTDWMSIVKPDLEDRMAQYMEGQIQFVLLSLVKDPLMAHRVGLVRNIKQIGTVEERLTRVERGWEGFASDGSYEEGSRLRGLLRGADLAYGITNVDVEEFVVDAEFTKKLEGEDVEGLMKIRQDSIAEQAGLRQAVRDEQEAVEEDERRARERRFDYGPLVYTWLKMLADKEGGVMKDLIEEVR